MKRQILFLSFILLSKFALAQDEVRINAVYNFDSYERILDDLANKYNAPIKFGTQDFSNLSGSFIFKNNTVSECLSKLFANTAIGFKFYQDVDGYYNIVKNNVKIIDAAKYENRPIFVEPTRFNFTVQGKIIDAQSGESLPFASVSIPFSSNATTTNVDGYYTLQNIPSDTAIITVSYVGYVTQNARLSPETKLNSFIIELTNSAQNLDEVTITAERTEVIKANEVVGMIKMTPRNIAKLPNVGERDPFRAFQLMPGVSASNESSSGLYIRGGTPDQTLVLYDGFTVYHVDHLFGFFSAFNYNAIKDIQLYKGGFDARFGGRISGVAEITGKDGNSKQFNAGVDLSLLSTNAFIESPLGKKFTFLLAGRRSYQGPIYNKIFSQFTSDETEVVQQGPGGGGLRGNNIETQQKANSYFYDLNAKLTFKPTAKDNISLSFFNGTDNMDNSSSTDLSQLGGGRFANLGIAVNNITNDLSTWGNTGASLKWSRQWGAKFYSNSLVSYSNYFSQRDNSRTVNVTRNDTTTVRKIGNLEDNNLQDFTAKADMEWKFMPNNQLEFGGQISKNTINFTNTQNDTTTILNRYGEGTISSAYVQDRLKALNGRLQVIPGVRLNYFDATAKVYVEPRLSFNFNLSERVKLKGAGGIYHQFIKQINREDITQGNRNFWILADGNSLPVTRSEHIIIGGSYETPNYLFDVEFYQKKNTGVTEYSLRFVPQITPGQRGGGLNVEETFFNGDETIQGVDFLLQKKFGKFNGWLGYTLSQGYRNIGTFSDQAYYSDQDVRHQFKAIGTYNYKNWDLAATWIYSTGRPYTSIIGAYSIELLDGTTKSYTNPSDKNANRFIDYQRLDLSATYNFSKGSVGFSVFNTYNRTNIWYKRFEIIDESGVSALQTTDVTYLGITPNITLSLKLR